MNPVNVRVESKTPSPVQDTSGTAAEGVGSFQFQDNRPETIAQRKLQDLANVFTANQSYSAIQKKENSQTEQRVERIPKNYLQGVLPVSMQTVQRMVYNIGSDETTMDTVAKVTKEGERNIDTETEGLPMVRMSPIFSNGLKKNEELKIVGHGDTNLGLIGGFTPQQLVTKLMSQGLHSGQHKGDINLIVCLSGIVPEVGHAVADAVCFYLRQEGYTNRVIGYEGLVHAQPDGSLRVIPPDRQDEFLAAKAESERLSAIDAEVIFEEMVLSEEAQGNPDAMSEYGEWEAEHVAAIKVQVDIMKGCYVTLGAHPELRRIVNFPSAADEEEWANMVAKWNAMKRETLVHAPAADGSKEVLGAELDPTTPLAQ